LRRLVRRMMADEQLLPTLCAESGKPRFEAEGIELFYTAELTRYFTVLLALAQSFGIAASLQGAQQGFVLA
jgi:preprotein translocase subunit SecY